jgi:hypothetical protein
MNALLTQAERLERAKGIRMYAIKLLGYYVAILPLTLPLALLRWIGDKAEDAFGWIDLPAYRWRSAQEDQQAQSRKDGRLSPFLGPKAGSCQMGAGRLLRDHPGHDG